MNLLTPVRCNAAVLAAVLTASACWSATLVVGPGRPLAKPSDAARLAGAGDTIRIRPGVYHDCAVWHADHLVIEGTGPGAEITGDTCEGKALFVMDGKDATIRNLTFRGAASPDANGAGVRAEGRNLTLDNVTFDDNQDGLLAGNNPASTIVIRHSTFDGNGACLPNAGCAHAVYVGHILLMRIEDSLFVNTKVGHHIKSRALRSEIVNSTIEDGPDGTSSYLIDLPNGGSLVLSGNTLEKGPHSGNHETAVSIGEEGLDQHTDTLSIEKNSFTNNGHQRVVFIRNATTAPAQLDGNVLKGSPSTALMGKGEVY